MKPRDDVALSVELLLLILVFIFHPLALEWQHNEWMMLHPPTGWRASCKKAALS